MTIRTVIVEDDPMVSKINSEFLKKLTDFSLVAKAKNGEEAISLLRISTLTIRKYLQYLAETDEIKLDLYYSKKGRPVKLYSLN